MRPYALGYVSVALALAAALMGCPVAPETGPQLGTDKEISMGGDVDVLTPKERGEATGNVVVNGRVLVAAKAEGYRLAALEQVPATEAQVEVHAFGASDLFFAQPQRTDAKGRFSFGLDGMPEPLFLRALAKVDGELLTLLAPVPQSDAKTITVDIDLASTMLAQRLIERIHDARTGAVLLAPDALGKLREHLDAALDAGTAPDLSSPTAVFSAFELLEQKDDTLKQLLDELESHIPPPPTPTPVPTPTTVTPLEPVPGPSMDDPPIYGGEGNPITAEPKPASYLSATFTRLHDAGRVTAVRFSELDEVFMAAVDRADSSLFTFFRDNGNPAHFTAEQLEVDTLLDVAADAGNHLYVLAPGEVARFRVGLGPKLDDRESAKDAAIADATALAVAPDGQAFYVGTAAGRVLKFVNAAVVSGFAPRLDGAIAALALGPAGELYAGTAEGAIVKIGADGAIADAQFATVPGLTSLAVNHVGSVYAGSGDKRVYRVSADKTAGTFLETSDPVPGVAILGGYLYLTQASGNLDCLTTGE